MDGLKGLRSLWVSGGIPILKLQHSRDELLSSGRAAPSLQYWDLPSCRAGSYLRNPSNLLAHRPGKGIGPARMEGMQALCLRFSGLQHDLFAASGNVYAAAARRAARTKSSVTSATSVSLVSSRLTETGRGSILPVASGISLCHSHSSALYHFFFLLLAHWLSCSGAKGAKRNDGWQSERPENGTELNLLLLAGRQCCADGKQGSSLCIEVSLPAVIHSLSVDVVGDTCRLHGIFVLVRDFGHERLCGGGDANAQ